MAKVYGISIFGLVRIALYNLRINFLRSFLTVLGMVFGTAAVIATLSSNEGSKRFIASELGKLGTNILSVEASGNPFTAADVALLKIYLPEIKTASLVNSIASLALRADAKSQSASGLGVDPSFFTDLRVAMRRGRFFTQTESTEGALVGVVGSKLSEELFGAGNGIGTLLHLASGSVTMVLEVIGELEPKGVNSGISFDTNLYLPRSLAERLAQSGDSGPRVFATLRSDDDTAEAKKGILAVSKSRHPDGLRIGDAREAIERTRSIWSNQNLVGIALAGISLLTGGVGIMNVMLLSIYQRRREIGLRKALGATRATIRGQFLLEAIFICAIGGAIGVACGCLFGQRVAALMGNWEAVVAWDAIALAIGCSMLIGLFFGLAPAIRASRLPPYDALRS